MKKLIMISLAASAFATPTISPAAHGNLIFDTRGECESDLKQRRNEMRKGSDENGGDFNRQYREDEECVSFKDSNGDTKFRIMITR